VPSGSSLHHGAINATAYDERVMEPTTIDDLFDLYEMKGAQHYGEGITQHDHALQCAALARADGVHDALTVAALFHDVGHLVCDVQGDEGYEMGRDDDRHEAIGARILAPLFGPRVAQPVALHVIAKRWLCSKEPEYQQRLSLASQATLIAQGGLLSEEECDRFEAHPGFNDAVALRTWDDAGKVEGLHVGELRDWEPIVRSLALR
jgi:phosphonate degradation associated HDIG domain protein